jgi:hypothetical protein
MSEEYTCFNCDQPVEAGAQFCGNCGTAVSPNFVNPEELSQPTPVVEGQLETNIGQVYDNIPDPDASKQTGYNQPSMATGSPAGIGQIPSYAIAYPHPKQHWAAIALAVGIIGTVGGLLVPVIGVLLGLVGIILCTTSYRKTSKGLKIAALIFSITAMLVGLGVWVFLAAHDPKIHPATTVSQAGTSNGASSLSVNTPCYSVTFTAQLNVNNSSGSCAMNAYNGNALTTSTDIYKVLSDETSGLTTDNFGAKAKTAVEADIAQNLPGFTITNEGSAFFAGSPAYLVQASQSGSGVSVIEEAVFHNSSGAQDNFFVLVHAENGQIADLNSFNNSWKWND